MDDEGFFNVYQNDEGEQRKGERFPLCWINCIHSALYGYKIAYRIRFKMKPRNG